MKKRESPLFVLMLISFIVIVALALTPQKEDPLDKYRQASKTSATQNSIDSNYPESVSSACFCMDALSGGEMYRASTKQKSQCKSMFKCWDNAQADCLMGTSQVWYECVN